MDRRTTEEYRQFLAIQEERAKAVTPANDDEVNHLEPDVREGLDYPTFIRRSLRRSPMPTLQRNLLRVMYATGDRSLTVDQMAERMKLTSRQMAGVFGGIGRRISDTPGSVQIAQHLHQEGVPFADKFPLATFVLWQKGADDDVWNYRLHPEVRKVLVEEGIVESRGEGVNVPVLAGNATGG